MPLQKSFSPADPARVPVEGPAFGDGNVASSREGKRDSQATVEANPYGLNNQQLPERLESDLRRLVYQFSFESEGTRRQEVSRIKQAQQLWRGLQYLWWNEADQNWHLPFEQKLADNSTLEDLPRYEFVTNVDQAFGLLLVALLSQDVPRARFFPASAQAEEDVAARCFQPDAAEVRPDLAQHAAGLLGPVAQILTGAFPALFGGAMSNNDTASGYAMARDQTMGRIAWSGAE